jgi:hypothetical protein
MWGLVAAPVGLGLASGACSGGVNIAGEDADGGVEPDGSHPADAGKKPLPDAGAADALPDYVDPGCPDAGPPVQMFECDPYKAANGCPDGQNCYIYGQPPADPCGQELYGSTCQPGGIGTQGTPCGSATDCASGYVCVISGSGTQCIELCKLSGDATCPPGLVCEPIDVEGFGGCL